MLKHCFIAIAFAFLAITNDTLVQADIVVVYDFESLTDNSNLVGQDNWLYLPAAGAGSAVQVSSAYSGYPGSAQISGKVARVAYGGFPGVHQEMGRVNNGSFPNFVLPSITTTSFRMEFTARLTKYDHVLFGLAYDANSDNTIQTSERSFRFGAGWNGAASTWKIFPVSGAETFTANSIQDTDGNPNNGQEGGVYRLRLDVDLTGTNAFGTMSVLHVGDKDGAAVVDSWTTVLSNVDLGFASASAPNFNALYLGMIPGSGYNGFFSGVDNLTVIIPSSEEIPEPSTLVLAGLALVGCLIFRRRR